MPSGAKKRKAAKKKKENQNQPNNHSDSASAPTHPHGEDDRESDDVGEASSPVSQDHQKIQMEREDEEIEKDSVVTDPLPMGVEEEESATLVEKEIKIEDELGKKEVIVDQIDVANREIHYDGDSSGSSAGSSSSISDDESHEIKKDQAESTIGSVEPVCDSVTAETGDSEKITASSDRVEFDVVSPADIAVAPRVTESTTLNENGNEKCCSAKGEANAQSAESNLTTLEPKASATQENEGRSTSPAAVVDGGAQHMKDSEVTQLVAAPSPYPIQKTSWKGCCGLFEVFSASGA